MAKAKSPRRRMAVGLIGLLFIIVGVSAAAPGDSAGAAALFAIAAALIFVGGLGLYTVMRREDSEH